MVEVSESLEQLYTRLKQAKQNYPQVVDLSLKIIQQAPGNTAALQTCLVGMIRARQFEEAL
jgi:tetratricopeptide (TPR) repeat protein